VGLSYGELHRAAADAELLINILNL